MKVLIATIFPYPHVGGVSTHLAALIEQLSTGNLLQGVIHGGQFKSPPFTRLAYAASWLINRDKARFRFFRSLADRLQRQIARSVSGGGPWVIHCHDPLASCARACGVPAAIVQTVHGPWSRESRMSGINPAGKTYHLIRHYEQEAFAGIDMALPVDQGQAAILTEEFGMPAERIRIIENAVDVEKLSAILIPSDSKIAATPYFIVPRRLVCKNGVEFALRALAQLDDCNARLMIAGTGPLRNSLLKLSKDLGIRSRVEFLGNVPPARLWPLMKGAEAVLVPSVPANGVIEATSLAVLEAMALHVPVIGSAIGGIADILSPAEKSNDSSYGILCRAGDPAGLARPCAPYSTGTRGKEASGRSRLSIEFSDRYGVDWWMAEILDAYQQAVENRATKVHCMERLWMMPCCDSYPHPGSLHAHLWRRGSSHAGRRSAAISTTVAIGHPVCGTMSK